MKIYKCSIANSQDSVDGIVHKTGQWKKEINYLVAKQERAKAFDNQIFFHTAIEISIKKFQLTLHLDF